MGRMGPAGVFEWFWLIVVDGWIMMLKEVDVVRSTTTTTMPHACRSLPPCMIERSEDDV